MSHTRASNYRSAVRSDEGGDMSFEVRGRSVIVTGGSRGIGFGIAEVFTDAGAHVTIVGRDRDVAA